MEWLEPRWLLATNLGGIVAVEPAGGAPLSQSPQDLVITLDQPYVPFLMGNFDVQLEELNRDGTTTPVWNSINAPIEQTDATGTELIIPVQTYDPASFLSQNLALSPGKYEIELTGGTGISEYASGAFGPGPELWDPSQPYAIGGFTLLGAGAKFTSATNLGTINSFGPPVLGFLNPDDYHSAVDLYKFTLAPGHFWEVGLSVSATSIGSDLLPALTLFNQDGTVMATRDAGTGLSNDPNDPYLITGLAPGTYYVGVSGAGNLPYGSNGYDPNLGIPGSAAINQPGGPFAFELSLAAQPHDQSTSLVDITVDRADLADPSPTGLTLTFSGPIDLSNLFVPDSQVTSLRVVDSTGRVWPATAEEYQVTDARLTLIFDQPLPAGRYSLIIPSQGGLNDLAGLAVAAPGEPPSVLATWTVAPSTVSRAHNDLGVLWPGTAGVNSPTLNAAFSQTTELAPGESETYRWVVTVPGLFKLQTQMGNGTIAIENFGNGQTTILDPGSTHQLNDYFMDLSDGVYGLRFINVGSQPVSVHWALKIAKLDWEKIVDNGVGQGSALSLMLFSPTPSDHDGNSIAGSQAISGSLAAILESGPSGPLPASLFVTLNTGLMGQPAPAGQNVAPVGPTVESGSISLADSTNGLQPGIRYESVSTREPGDADELATAVRTGMGTVVNDQAIRQAAGSAKLRLDPEVNSALADTHALAQADWLVGLGARIRSWLVPSPAAPEIKPTAVASLDAMATAGDDPAAGPGDPAGFVRNKRATSSAQFDIGAAASLIVGGAVAYRLRQPLQKWWRRTGRLASNTQAPAKRFSQGPHPVSTRARATTHARRVHTPR